MLPLIINPIINGLLNLETRFTLYIDQSFFTVEIGNI